MFRTPTADTRADSSLLAAHVAGDPSAFGELFRRHQTRLYRAARRRGATAEDADDTVQDAMLSAYLAAGSFRNESAVGSWLHRITVNSCTDLARRNARRTAVLAAAQSPAAPDRSPAVDTALVVRQALMRLPVAQRAALLAVDMHGYSVSEAAALLDIAEGTVKSRCARGRARLAVLLAPPGTPAPTLMFD